MDSSPLDGAQYGKACTNCARAKAKCVHPNPDIGGKCERCHRLNKDCQRSRGVRTRKSTKKTTKVDRLEEKLDGLVTLLKSTSQKPAQSDFGNGDTLVPMPDQLTSSPLQTNEYDRRNENGDQPGFPLTTGLGQERIVGQGGGFILNVPILSPDTPYVASGTRSSTHHSSTPLSVRGEPSTEEAEQYFGLFREQMMQYSPFMSLPASITNAEILRQEHPFLWLCIMAISSKSTEQQKALGREIRLTIGREMLLEGKSNLDLLLGILTYSAWVHYHMREKAFITQIMQLAIGLLGNLGLKKSPPKEPLQVMLNLDARGCPKPFNQSARTLEERRTGLWCWLISSTTACYFQKHEPLPWSPYLEECLQMIVGNREDSADMLLVQFIRLQLIVEKATQVQWRDGPFDPSDSASSPSRMYLNALRTQLQDVKQAVPPVLFANRVLPLHTYSTEMTLHEISLLKTPSSSSDPDLQRLDSLYACLRAAKDWFDAFLMILPADYIGISMAVFTQMAHAITTLYRLSTLEYSGWDCGAVRDTANLSSILGQIVTKMAQVKNAAALDEGVLENQDIFSISSCRVESIKSWWDSKKAAELTVYRTSSDQTMDEAPVDVWDDAWLQDVLGMGPNGFEPLMQ